MANSIPKKRAKAEQVRKKRAQAASALATGSGIQPRGRASSYSADGAASFAAMFPDAMKVRLL